MDSLEIQRLKRNGGSGKLKDFKEMIRSLKSSGVDHPGTREADETPWVGSALFL
jgi:hypothetical protein